MNNNRLLTLLKEQSANGIDITVITSKEDEQYNDLASSGLHVIAYSGLSICTVIIDKSLVWYGSVNVLGYPAEEDNIIKLKDAKLATELLKLILQQ